MNRKLLINVGLVVVATLICGGIVYAASLHNVTSTLGGVSGDYFQLDGTLSVGSLKVGAQGVGGVTFFNGTIVNNTTTNDIDNPVTFGDNVRIDGRVYRGATAGTDDTMPFIVNDNMEVAGNLTLGAGKTLTVPGTLDVTGATVTGLTVSGASFSDLSSANLTDVDSIAMLDEAEVITANWVNTLNPWSSGEIADITRRVEIPLSDFYTDADNNPAAITTLTTPNLAYTANQGLAIVYSATETTDIGTQFTVPDDYASGGVFKILVDTSAAIIADLKLDFRVAISQTKDTAAWDTDMDDEDPVDVPDNAGEPTVITLTPTDQSDISAGDVIFLDIFPDTYAAGEPDLEIYAAWFEYTAVQ